MQGELLRVSGSVCSLVLDGFVTDWAEFPTRVKLYYIPHFLRKGNPLLREEIREAKRVIRELIREEKILRPEKLCELTVSWIRKNPDPIPLGRTFYD